MQNNNTYNFIICGDPTWSPFMFGDLGGMEGIKLYFRNDDGFDGLFQKMLWHINCSKKVNKIIKRPFNNFVVRNTWNYQFDNGKPVCYIVLGDRASVFNNQALIDYWRESRPYCILVLYIVDLVARNPLLNVDYIQRNFDYVISYDKGDADHYGWYYYPTPFSHISHPAEVISNIYDLYFCGLAKNRLSEILQVYEKAIEKGLSCKFFIGGVSKQEQKQKEGIIYNYSLSYAENIQFAMRSKCIVEIMQKNATGFTPRLWEAIMLDKHLITNNTELKNSSFYIPNGMHFINEMDDNGFIDSLKSNVVYSVALKEKLSPKRFINFVNDIIERDSRKSRLI